MATSTFTLPATVTPRSWWRLDTASDTNTPATFFPPGGGSAILGNLRSDGLGVLSASKVRGQDGVTQLYLKRITAEIGGTVVEGTTIPVTGVTDVPPVTAQAAAQMVLDSLATTYVRSPGVSTAFAGVIATLRRAQRSSCVAIIGDSTGDGYLAGGATLVDEWPQVFIKRLAADYPAYTLLQRVWNDSTQGYDPPTTLQTGLGTAVSGTGSRYAQFVTASPTSLQYTAAHVTTDIDVRLKLSLTDWTPSGAPAVISRWVSTGNQRSWFLQVTATGALSLNWTADGLSGGSLITKTSTAIVPFADGDTGWIRCTLDVDNGASGNDVKFYTSTDGVTWTQLGTTVTTAGVTSMFASTGPYQMGSFSEGFSNPMNGKIYWAEVRNGLASGQSLVPPLVDGWEVVGGESTVTFGGAPVLMLLNGSASGQNVTYFDNSTRRPIINQPHGQGVVLLSTGHNDLYSRQTWVSQVSTWVGNIKTLVPGVPIVLVGQNPVGLGGSFSLTQQQQEMHASRSAILMQWAASQAGVYPFDAWPATVAAETLDQLHPGTGAGSGSEKWGRYLYDRITKP